MASWVKLRAEVALWGVIDSIEFFALMGPSPGLHPDPFLYPIASPTSNSILGNTEPPPPLPG